MNYQSFTIIFLTAAISMASSETSESKVPAYQNSELAIEERVEDLISRMNLKEKIAQASLFKDKDLFITGKGELRQNSVREMLKYGGGMAGFINHSLDPLRFAQINNEIQRILTTETRLGIPALIWGEGLHGFVGKDSTCFPIPMALASTWDTELIEAVFVVVGKEARAVGVTQLYDPVLGLAREPRWGRVGETFGEDPLLVSRMASSAIVGLQGREQTIDESHVAATAKHFVAHSQPEGGNNIAPGNFSERIIRENFMYPFEVAVKKAGVKCVMPSYNEIDGIPSHANSKLLRDILRDEWGFDGYVVGDLGGIEELYRVHCVVDGPEQAARVALEAGVDMDPVKFSRSYIHLEELIRKGEVDKTLLDDAVRRILTLKFELGLFEDPFVDLDRINGIYHNPEHRQLALRVAEESIILLKNKSCMLPLDRDDMNRIAVIGPNAAEVHFGTYSREPYTGISVLEGIQSYADGHFEVSYAEGCKITKNQGTFWREGNAILNALKEDRELTKQAVETAKQADVVLLVLGGNENTSREAWSETHRGDREDLDLFGRQEELHRAILETGIPVVVLLLNERPLSVGAIAETADALLEAWFLGQETGHAVARVLFGDVNPSGKLPVTIPGSVGQLPCYYNRKPSRMRNYIGAGKPLYPFGFGLSYTTFEYSDLEIDPIQIQDGKNTTVRITVTNTGDVVGDEIVQLYIRDQVSSVTRPVKELKAFQKIQLESGESKTLQFVITPDMLQFYDANMKRIVEPGAFSVMVGGDSEALLEIDFRVNPLLTQGF